MSKVILWDLMDTVVKDPFFTHMAPFFGMGFEELMAAKHPTAWGRFELARIDEATLFEQFFSDGRSFDGAAFKRHVMDAYDWVEGTEALLGELKELGVPMHALSNYPHWVHEVDARLAISQYLPLSFISCETGVRKPAPDAFLGAARSLGVTPDRCLFVDDRQPNVDAALKVGMDAVRFTDTATLRDALKARALL